MMKLLRAAVVLLILVPSVGVAQDAVAGLRAYAAGDYATALREWRPLALQGDAALQGMLGTMYYEGLGVPQDYTEALRFYRLAAEQGSASAQAMLGTMYFKGQAVPQSYVFAHMWINIAYANGSEGAAEVRDMIASLLLPADISEAQRRAGVCLASDYQDCD